MALDPPSEKYRVRIESKNIGMVKAWVPDEIQLSLESSWDAPYADIGSGTIGTALSLVGFSLKTKTAATQVWGGSSPITVTLPLEFIADTDADLDVKANVKKLLQMAAPGLESGGEIYRPPGPTLYDLRKLAEAVGLSSDHLSRSGDRINIYIGKSFIVFKNVVLLSVNPSFPMKMSKTGNSTIRAKVELTFRTYTTLAKSDIDKVFPSGSPAS